jgi:hypothetical protein
MAFCLNDQPGFKNKRFKGVSPVIATMLLVLLTVVLVSSVYKFSDEIASGAKKQTDESLTRNKQMHQAFVIPTAYGCGPYICFELKALGTNSMPIPIENAGYYINDVPKKSEIWPGSLPLGSYDCSSNPVLNPGESCFGRLDNICRPGDILRIQISWGTENFRSIMRCN